MDDKKLEVAYNRLKQLNTMKGKTEEELREKARAVVRKSDINIAGKFSDKEEQRLATLLVEKYLDDYTLETISEKNTLREIIYLEVVQARLQKKLNEMHQKNLAMPTQLIDIIHRNTDAILRLKATIGLVRESQKTEEAYDVLAHLKKRYSKWMEENQGTRAIVCPHCVKMIMLKIRTEAWEAQKHPFFKDRLLYNKHLMELYKQNKITKEDVAKILEESLDYIDWVIDRVEGPTVSSEEPQASSTP